MIRTTSLSQLLFRIFCFCCITTLLYSTCEAGSHGSSKEEEGCKSVEFYNIKGKEKQIKAIQEQFFNLHRAPSTEVDVVITWVNGTDGDWKNKLIRYNLTYNEARFQSFNEIEMNILSLLAYGGKWLGRIFIVTADQQLGLDFIPSQFSHFKKKILFVNHKDFIPKRFLPTFNSLVIEMFLYRISGLSETFIYLNDDMFFARPFDIKRLHNKDHKLITPASIEKNLCAKIDDDKFHKGPNRYVIFNTVTLVYHVFPKSDCLSYANDNHYPIVQSKVINELTFHMFRCWYERQGYHRVRSTAHLVDSVNGFGGFQPLLLTQYVGHHLGLSRFSDDFKGLHTMSAKHAHEDLSKHVLDFLTMQDLYKAKLDLAVTLCVEIVGNCCKELTSTGHDFAQCIQDSSSICDQRK